MTDKMSVVVVDDEWIIREGFRKLFQWEKHHCEMVGEASDGVEAIMIVERTHPDILIIDINLPIVSGLEAIRTLKGKYPDLSIIIISGYDDFHYCQEALHLRVADYLLKPIKYEELGEVIQKIRIQKINHDKTEHAGNRAEKSHALVHKITEYIQENFKNEITLEILSQEFHVGGAYISKKFKQATGTNYYEYLTWVRMEKAKDLLYNSAASITEVAGLVGFHDYRIFIKSFKDKTGLTPGEFRKRYDDEKKKG